MKEIIKYDLKQLTKHEYSRFYFLYSLITKRGFRLVYLFRKSKKGVLKFWYRWRFSCLSKKMTIEISYSTQIGKGLTLGHPSSIVVNPEAIIGEDVSISHGVTIGKVQSGKRKGCPIIGNHVYIGANVAIVGGITIGNNVLIAANSFVDFDVPDNSLVFGNPGIIKYKDNPTKDYH